MRKAAEVPYHDNDYHILVASRLFRQKQEEDCFKVKSDLNPIDLAAENPGYM